METGKVDSLEFYPFAYSLYSENIAHYCWYCLDDERTHRKCSGCKTAVFCDKDCQQLAWKDHKYECRGIKATTKVPNIEVRLLGRIVVRYKAILCGKDKEDPNFYTNRASRRSIMDIWAHTTSMSQDQYAMKKFNAIYDELTTFYDSRALLSRDVVFQLHCRDFINRHAISDRAYIKEIGKGLYLDLCAYDHSCRPNTIYVCDGTKAVLRPLDSGVNLLDRSTTFYSYIDLLCGKQERRKLLKDTWYFHCECDRCKDNSEHILVSMNCPHCKVDPPQRLCLFGEHPYKDPETQLINCSTCHKQLSREEVMETLGAMRFIDDLLERSNFDQMGREESVRFLEDLLKRFGRLLPRINIYYCKIVQALIPLIDLENNRRLLDLHLEVEECIRVCYPHNHPALGFHLRNIGIFSKKLEDYDKAVAYLTEAFHIFKFVMRDEHLLTKSTQSFLNEAVRQRVGKLATIEVKRHNGDGELATPSKFSAIPGDGAGGLSSPSSRSSSQQRRVTVRCEVFSGGQSIDNGDADVGGGTDCNAKSDGTKGIEAACNVETVVAAENVKNIGVEFCLNPNNVSDGHQQNFEPCTLSTEVEEVELEVVNHRRSPAEECVEGSLVDASVEDDRRAAAGHRTFRKEVRKEQGGGKPKSKKTGIKMPKADGGSLPRKVNAESPRVPSAIEDGSGRKPRHHNDAGEKRSSGPRSPKKLEIPVIDGAQEEVSIVVPNPSNSQSSTPLSTTLPHHHAHKHHIHHHHHERNKDDKADEAGGSHENLTSLLLVGGEEGDPNEPLFVDTAGGVKKKAAHKKVSPRSRTPIPPALLAFAAAANRSVCGAVDDENADADNILPSSSSALAVPTLAISPGGITSDTLEADLPALSTLTSAHVGNSITVSGCDDDSTVLSSGALQPSEPSSPNRHFDIVSTTTLVRKSRQLYVDSLSMSQLPQSDGGGDSTVK